MCFKRKRADPAIAKQQAQQKADVAATRESDLAAATAAREKQLEEIKQATADYKSMQKQQKEKNVRQAELDNAVVTPAKKAVATPTKRAVASEEVNKIIGSELTSSGTVKKSSVGMAKRRTKRGGRGRRSLLSSSGGGVGYFSRFL